MTTDRELSAAAPAQPATLSAGDRYIVLSAAFLGWMFAGVQMATFPLVTGDIVRDIRGRELVGIAAVSTSQIDQQISVEAGQWFGYYIAAFLLGAATGGLLFGWLGDRIGRAKTMGLSILCYSLVHGLCYFATTLEQLLVLRFVACLGVGGMWPTGVALASEAWSEASRPALAGVIGTSANVGIALVGVMGDLFEVTEANWRWVMVFSASPVVLGILVLLLVPESPRWLFHRSRSPLEGATDHPSSGARRGFPSTGAASGHSVPITTVFRMPYLPLTLIGIALGTIPLLGGWGTSNWLIKWADQVGEEVGNPGLKATTIWVGSTGAAIGSLLGGWLANLFGRRNTYFAISLGALLTSGYVFWFLSPAAGLTFFLWLFLLRLISTTYFGWLPFYLPELFPTHVRSTGSGVAFNFGRILTAAGVLGTSALIGVFAGDYAQVGRITHLVFAAGMIVILFAPDTSERRLTD